MTVLQRRALLASFGVALTAGCGAPDTDPETDTERPDADSDGVPNREDDYPNDGDLSETLRTVSDTRNIEEDHWRAYNLQFPRTGELAYEFLVEDGPAIDVLVIDSSEYETFSDGRTVSYHTYVSEFDTTGGTVRGKMDAGSYYLIFDNTSRGDALPPTNFSNDVVTVSFSIETAR